jgi:hypothetical protein
MGMRADIARQESMRWPATEPPVPRFMTLQQFCEVTATAENTARGWVRDGKLRAVTANAGHSLRIPVTEVTRIFQPLKPSKNDEGEWNWADAIGDCPADAAEVFTAPPWKGRRESQADQAKAGE